MALVGALLFGFHVAEGGRYSDGWSIAARIRFDAGGAFGATVDRMIDSLGARPLAAVYVASVGTLLPEDVAVQLGLQAALAGVASLLFFIVLRTAGLAAGWAGAAAVLSFIFPWADATRLWTAAAPYQLCVIFFFAGVLAALRGLRAEDGGWIWHSVAVALYLLSLLVNEAASIAILLAGLLYVAVAGWDRAKLGWAIDVAVIVSAIAILYGLSRTARSVPGIETTLAGVYHLPDQGGRLLLEAFVPLPIPTLGRALILLCVAGGVSLALLRLNRSSRAELVRPVALVALSLAALGAAWVPFLGAELWPSSPGVDNRGNLMAAFVFALLVTAVSYLVGSIVARALRTRSLGTLIAAALVAIIGTGWAVTAHGHVDDYARATRSQERLLSGLKAAIPSPGSNSTLYVVGQAAQSAPGVPIFSQTWDLKAAVQLEWNDPSLRAFPIVGLARLRCRQGSVVPQSPRLQATAVLESGLGPRNSAMFGHAYVYDAERDRAFRIDDARSCRSVIATTSAGDILDG